ncbi:hypothetical protein KI387_043880 [Taxus chinensis]|uniref:Pentatricopeptide repeat-containing protein n=1 Tax=Taxus chinensis TaxID=29808 RepID=A0AA38FHP9_TAXCH|nr:hypothetical protein KI387_043880 [Taxus chinensis]
MQLAGVVTGSTTFSNILQACPKVRDLEQGMNNHQSITERGFLLDVVVANALLDVYAKYGSPHKARQLFDKMTQKDVISWTAMATRYVQNGVLNEALRLFEEMPQRNVVSWNATISGYAQNGVLDKALRIFEKMPQRNMVSWTAMIARYAQNGFVEKALETFRKIQLVGVNPDSTTFVNILPSCAKMGALEQGIDIHQSIMERGLFSYIGVANALVDMYAKCGRIHKARELIDIIPEKM